MTAAFSVLKDIAKSSKLDTFKSIAVKDGVLEASNLEIIARVDFETTAENGIYDIAILDLLKVSATADISAYKLQSIENWMDYKEATPAGSVTSSKVVDAIIEGMPYASTDYMRPILCGIWLTGSEVMATDGYKLYLSGVLDDLKDHTTPVGLPNNLLKLLKKVASLSLTLHYNIDMNEVCFEQRNSASFGFKLIGKPLAGTPPEARKIANGSDTFTHVYTIPYKALKPLFNRNSEWLEVKTDGTLLLDGKPVPAMAKVETEDKVFLPHLDRYIIMGSSVANIAVNPKYLAPVAGQGFVKLYVKQKVDGTADKVMEMRAANI